MAPPAEFSDSALYHSTVVHRKLCIPFSSITNFKCIEEHMLHVVSGEIEGRCIPEGYVKQGSCGIRSYSVGTFSAGNIRFDLEVDCMLCCPKEGATMVCIAKTVTQAGIRAHARTKESTPMVIYISREMHDAACASTRMLSMDSIKPGDAIQIRVVGRRFELNDKQVSIIGELVACCD